MSVTLDQLCAGKPCRVFANDVRLHIAQAKLYTYPDVMVVCGKIEVGPRQKDTLMNPVAIFDIFSGDNWNDPRGDRFQQRRAIPSLQDYVMVDQT